MNLPFYKQRLVKGAALIVTMMVANSLMAQGTTSNTAAPQAMLDMQYADELGCFIIHGDEVRPVMPLLVSSDGLPDVVHDHVVAALDDALARGCDINQSDLNGLSPLNTAILQSNVALVTYLIEHGADAAAPISSMSEEIDGLDSLGLLDILSERAPEQEAIWQQIRDILDADGVGHSGTA